jgi:MFS family permease
MARGDSQAPEQQPEIKPAILRSAKRKGRTMASIMTTEAYEAYIRRNERWNFVVNVADLTFYNFALSFIFGSTVLTLYTSHLTSSTVLIGLIPAIQNVGYFLPQLIMARVSERLHRKKPLVVKCSVVERLPYLFVALLILAWPTAPKWLSYTMLATCLAIATLAGGLGGPAWNGMLAKVIHAERRGLLFGLSSATGGLLGVVGAFISQRLLAAARPDFLLPYGFCFLLCFVFQVASWVSLTLNREPPQQPAVEAHSTGAYFRRLPEVLRSNTNFSRYLGGRTLLILGGMGATFYIIYAQKAFQINDAFGGQLTMAALIAQTVCAPVLGWLSDKRGHKWLTELATLLSIGTAILVLLATNAQWFYVIYVLLYAASTGMMVSGMSLVLEFSSPSEVPTYSALASTVLAVPILVAPLLGGWLAGLVGFRVLFVIAIALLGLGWTVMHWGVHEPGRRPLDEAERLA